jgi:hypothetical protein
VEGEEENEVEKRSGNQDNININNKKRDEEGKEIDQDVGEKCENNRFSIDRRLKFTEMESVATKLSSSPGDNEEATIENVPKEHSQEHSEEYSPERSLEPSKLNSFVSDAGLSVDRYGTYGKDLTGRSGYAGSLGNTVTLAPLLPVPPPPLLPPPPPLLPFPSHNNGNEIGSEDKTVKNFSPIESVTTEGPKSVTDRARDTDGVNIPAVSTSTNSLQRYGTARKINRLPVAGRGRGVKRTALVPK